MEKKLNIFNISKIYKYKLYKIYKILYNIKINYKKKK